MSTIGLVVLVVGLMTLATLFLAVAWIWEAQRRQGRQIKSLRSDLADARMDLALQTERVTYLCNRTNVTYQGGGEVVA